MSEQQDATEAYLLHSQRRNYAKDGATTVQKLRPPTSLLEPDGRGAVLERAAHQLDEGQGEAQVGQRQLLGGAAHIRVDEFIGELQVQEVTRRYTLQYRLRYTRRSEAMWWEQRSDRQGNAANRKESAGLVAAAPAVPPTCSALTWPPVAASKWPG